MGNYIGEPDFTKRCKCAVQYKKGKHKDKWCPDHIHLTRHKDTGEEMYYCGECNKYYPIREAVEVN